LETLIAKSVKSAADFNTSLMRELRQERRAYFDLQTYVRFPYVCKAVVLNLFHCWDPLNATDVVWDPQVKIEKVCAPE